MQQEVTVYLGEKERAFTTNVRCEYDKGDYYQPSSVEFYVEGDIYDEENGVVTDLIERYESIYKVDFNALAIEEFRNEY
jgi:hypothetical protein